MAGMGPQGQETGEWLQLLFLKRGKRIHSQHRERSSTSTPVLLYGDMREDGDIPWAHSVHPHLPFREGGAQRMGAGAQCITQQSFPKL